MPRFYFDIRDGDKVISDDAGLELPDIHAARKLAARAVGEMARDAAADVAPRTIAVEVKDGSRAPLLEATASLEVIEKGATP
jgi:hypothetical protein